ncbi:MAG: M23 family metallopeptidase [Rickettsiales bacterium]
MNRILSLLLILVVSSCETSLNQKAVVSYKNNVIVGQKNVGNIESKVATITQKKYDGHTIFSLDLLNVDSKRNKYLYKVPYVSRSQYFLRTLLNSPSTKNYYKNSYIKNITKQSSDKKRMIKSLGVHTSKKIRELQIFTRRIHKRMNLHRIRHSNPMRQTIAKMDQYLTKARAGLNKLSLDQKLLILRKTLTILENIPAAVPLENFRVSSRFKVRWHPIQRKRVMHKGIDLVGKKRAPVLATANGVVSFAGRQSGYGKTIIIEHSNTSSTLYAHLNTILVSKGERVRLGEKIAIQGNTGSSTNDHLHYETRLKNQQVNPEIFTAF